MASFAPTGDGPKDANAYLNRPFCVSELRWRFATGKHLQPIVHLQDKTRIGEFIGMAPDDLKKIGGIDFVDLNPSDADYWQVGLKKIFEKAVDGGALPEPSAAPAEGRYSWIKGRCSWIPCLRRLAEDKTALVVETDGVGMTESISGDVGQPAE